MTDQTPHATSRSPTSGPTQITPICIVAGLLALDPATAHKADLACRRPTSPITERDSDFEPGLAPDRRFGVSADDGEPRSETRRMAGRSRTTGSGDQGLAAAPPLPSQLPGPLRASDADREQVIGLLKAASAHATRFVDTSTTYD
jgi:hypothetical protein